ncbi:PH domain-containing protein [Nonomuraea rubra]|uniref:PH domain-containing protein n=1 Tax=Nonomuraea rubra TaxID=46180 RepID=UPI0031EEA9B6
MSRSVRTIPLERIRGVDVSNPPMHRLLGLTILKIDTGASGDEEEAKLAGVLPERGRTPQGAPPAPHRRTRRRRAHPSHHHRPAHHRRAAQMAPVRAAVRRVPAHPLRLRRRRDRAGLPMGGRPGAQPGRRPQRGGVALGSPLPPGRRGGAARAGDAVRGRADVRGVQLGLRAQAPRRLPGGRARADQPAQRVAGVEAGARLRDRGRPGRTLGRGRTRLGHRDRARRLGDARATPARRAADGRVPGDRRRDRPLRRTPPPPSARGPQTPPVPGRLPLAGAGRRERRRPLGHRERLLVGPAGAGAAPGGRRGAARARQVRLAGARLRRGTPGGAVRVAAAGPGRGRTPGRGGVAAAADLVPAAVGGCSR